MADKRSHRGADPRDAKLFAPSEFEHLRAASSDYAWLLSHGYAAKSSLKLVGDRYDLAERQRRAVQRATCTDDQRAERARREVTPDAARGRSLAVDGYNILTTIEGALGGAVILEGRDRCMRDLAGLHGSYRIVAETTPAIDLIGETLTELEVASAHWLIDQPVSNSGRLKKLIEERAAARGWPWRVEVVRSPDNVLVDTNEIAVTADSAVLDRCGPWLNLAGHVIRSRVPAARVLSFV